MPQVCEWAVAFVLDRAPGTLNVCTVVVGRPDQGGSPGRPGPPGQAHPALTLATLALADGNAICVLVVAPLGTEGGTPSGAPYVGSLHGAFAERMRQRMDGWDERSRRHPALLARFLRKRFSGTPKSN